MEFNKNHSTEKIENVKGNDRSEKQPEPKSSNKKETKCKRHIPLIIRLLALLLIVESVFLFKFTKRNNISQSKDKKFEESAVAAIRTRLDSIFAQVEKRTGSEELQVKKYFSSEFNTLYKKINEMEVYDYMFGVQGIYFWDITFWQWDVEDDDFKVTVKDIIYINEKKANVILNTHFEPNPEELVRKDTISLIYENENWVIDDIHHYKENFIECLTRDSALYNAYSTYKTLLNANYDDEFFTYDIDNDDIPELWIKSGTCEADYILLIYKYTKNGVRKVYRGGAGHSGFYMGDGYILQTDMHMGYAYWYKYTFDGKEIKRDQVFYEDISNVDRDYTMPKEEKIVLKTLESD